MAENVTLRSKSESPNTYVRPSASIVAIGAGLQPHPNLNPCADHEPRSPRSVKSGPFAAQAQHLSGVPTGMAPQTFGRALLSAKQRESAKRLTDILIAAILLVVSLPLLGAIWLAIRISSPGPALYIQDREGFDGRFFGMLKFRTMHLDAEQRLEQHLRDDPDQRHQWARFYKLKHDPRIIPYVGNLLRKSSLDELPQLLNVLRGEMSLVGPRPFPAYHLQAFNQEFRQLRRSVRPGITGLWQVAARSEGDLSEQERLDREYIRNKSNRLDCIILLRTIGVVIGTKGAY
jgi:lipopolysaccharide/colanic/teichoic acid biosynthesis glycosyltransferase